MAEQPEPDKSGGFVSDVVNLYFAPGEGLRFHPAPPRLLAPRSPATSRWASSSRPSGCTRWSPASSSRARWRTRASGTRCPRSSAPASSKPRARFVPVFGWVFAVLGAPIVGARDVSGVLLFVYRFFYASEVTFPRPSPSSPGPSWRSALVAVSPHAARDGTQGRLEPEPPGSAPGQPDPVPGEGRHREAALGAPRQPRPLVVVAPLPAGHGLRRGEPAHDGSAFWGVAVCWRLIVLARWGSRSCDDGAGPRRLPRPPAMGRLSSFARP